MKKTIANKFPVPGTPGLEFRSVTLLFMLCFTVPFCSQSQGNLITNGDFETGSVTGFTSNYSLVSGPSAPGQYTITTDPGSFNAVFSNACQDHTPTGTGYMMVVDGATNSGNKIWEQSPGGGIQVVAGKEYMFSYWISNVSTTNIVGSFPEIEVRINGNIVGSQLCPPALCGWTQVSYKFTATSNYVQIWLFDLLTTFSGNDFALDDLELKEVPPPLGIRYSVNGTSCPGSSDGSITVYGYGGTAPYSYSINGVSFTANNIFANLDTSVSYIVAVADSKSPGPDTVYSQSIKIPSPVNPLLVRTDTTICPGAPVILSASSSSGGYSWTANPADASLTAPNTANPVVSPAVTTVYTVSSTISSTVNLIFNGDFSGGDLGFTSDYAPYSTNTNKVQKAYGVLSNPNDFETGFAACADHTGSGGKMLVADGSLNSSDKVWCQSVPVKPSTTYTFSYWVQTIVMPAPAQIEIQINGLPITGTAATSILTAPSTTCTWVQYSTTWNSGASTTAQICFYNRNNAAGGNDFAIDDISFSTSTTCVVQKAVTVTVSTAAAPVTDFSYVSPVCSNAADPVPVKNTGFTTGGTFSSTTGLAIDAVTGVIDLAGSTAGTYTVTYAVTAAGCTGPGSSSSSITINASVVPGTNFSYTSPVCINGTDPVPSLSSGFTGGGTFSFTSGLSVNTSSGVIDLSASAAGTYTITYSVAAGACVLAGIGTATITINNTVTPVTGFSYPSPVCNNAANVLPSAVTGFAAGGVYAASAGMVINAATGEINIAGSVPGIYTVTYTVPASGCILAGSGTSSITINQNTVPGTGFSYATPVCSNASNPLPLIVSGFTTGGTFTSTTGLAITTSTGEINIAGSTPGTYTVTYTVPASGCILTGSGTAPITITQSTAPGTGFSYTTPVCLNGANPVPLLVNGFTPGGTFVSTAGISINASTGVIDLSATAPGTYTVTYSTAAAGCQAAGSSIFAITINSSTTPITDFTYNSPVCAGSADAVPVTATGFTTGGIFTSTAGLSLNAQTGVINLSASSAGTYNINYAVAASGCATGNGSNTSITIKPRPVISSVTPGSNCGPGAVDLSAIGPGIITWYSDAGLNNVVATGNDYSPVLSNTATYYVSAADNGCSGEAKTITATINSLPQKPGLGPDKLICSGDILLLTAGIYENYLWQDNSTASSFTVNAAGEYSVTVSTAAGCSNGDTILVTIDEACGDIYFPNAFSPGGINKSFGALGNLSQVKNYMLEVYNRYGQLLFSTSNPAERWDGTFKGKPVGINNYTWYVKYLFRGRINKLRKGNVMVVR